MTSPTFAKQGLQRPATLALQTSDLDNIVLKLRMALADYITAIIRSCFKQEIENCVKQLSHSNIK